jgi:hypothetical protein
VAPLAPASEPDPKNSDITAPQTEAWCNNLALTSERITI